MDEHTKLPWDDNGVGCIFGDMNSDHDGDNPFICNVRPTDSKSPLSEEEKANIKMIKTVNAHPAVVDFLESRLKRSKADLEYMESNKPTIAGTEYYHQVSGTEYDIKQAESLLKLLGGE